MSSQVAPVPLYPAAVDRGPFRFLSGMSQSQPADVADPTSWVDRVEGKPHAEALAIHERVRDLLEDVGGHGAMLREHIYQADKRRYPIFELMRVAHEPTPAPSSGVGVDLVGTYRDAAWEVDGIALSPSGLEELGARRHIGTTKTVPSASFYSQAVAAGPYVFMAGMIPMDTTRGKMISGYGDVEERGRLFQTGRSHPDSRRGPIVAQTWWIYQQVLDTLGDAGLTAEDLCSVTIFLRHAADAADALRVHHELLGDAAPAVQLIPLDEIGHRGMLIEIECTAYSGEHRRAHEGPAPGVSQTFQAGRFVFTSDHFGLAQTGTLCRSSADVSDVVVAAHLKALAQDFADPAPVERAMAQTWAALDATRRSLDLGASDNTGLDPSFLWVRLVRPFGLAVFEAVRPLVFPHRDFALSLLSVPEVAQDSGSLVAISAIGVVESST